MRSLKVISHLVTFAPGFSCNISKQSKAQGALNPWHATPQPHVIPCDKEVVLQV